MTVIQNAKAVLEDLVLEDATILVENGRILSVESGEKQLPDGAEVIDAEGLYVGPGFVDIHVHGGNGYMFDAEPLSAAEHFLRHGETTVLATLYYTLSKDEWLAAVQ
ncbi:MAG: amidohydrolase family protein, partial [Clostridia bacterium]|nr:amidohydrolase family protein [Clostridia bacterium]